MLKIKLLGNAYITNYNGKKCYKAIACDLGDAIHNFDPMFDRHYVVIWQITDTPTELEEDKCNWDLYTVYDNNNIVDATIKAYASYPNISNVKSFNKMCEGIQKRLTNEIKIKKTLKYYLRRLAIYEFIFIGKHHQKERETLKKLEELLKKELLLLNTK